MDTYTTLYRHLFYPAWEGLRRRPTLSRLRYLLATERRSADELIAMQTGALRRLLCHAYEHVAAYRARLDEAGLDPFTVRDPADLVRLPLLPREEAQGAQSDLHARGGVRGRVIVKSTSGTTGNPFRFRYNYESEVWRQALKLRAYGWAGYVPGMSTVHYWGPPAVAPQGLKSAKIALDRALRREIYLDCARQGEEDLLATVRLLRRVRPRCLIGFTQATVELARFIVRRGLRDWPDMQVLCGAERLFPQDRPLLEQALGGPGTVYETYGSREFMLIASECPAHTGLHVSMENLIVEVVDDHGRPVPPGTVGQVVVTDLHNYAMPLIRYATRDLAVAVAPSSRCPCGRGLLRLSSIEGRQQDLLRGRDGRGIPGIIFNALFASLGGKVQQFQAVQRKDGHIALKVVPGPEFDDQVMEGLRRRLQPYLGDLPLSVDLVPTIPPLPSGKRRYVIVET